MPVEPRAAVLPALRHSSGLGGPEPVYERGMTPRRRERIWRGLRGQERDLLGRIEAVPGDAATVCGRGTTRSAVGPDPVPVFPETSGPRRPSPGDEEPG